MKLLHFATALATSVLALPSPVDLEPELETRQLCTTPKLRKSWAAATSAEKQSYINAVLCLATKPSRLNVSTHSTLYDDFGYVHAQLSQPQQIHFEPAFLPWHRYFVHVYEGALKQCGYTGTAMYWDWVADSAAPANSSVFSPTLGFGGNGDPATKPANNNFPRIINGPFRNLRPTYWNKQVLPHYLSRDSQPGYPEYGVIEMNGELYRPTPVNAILAIPDYETFRHRFENEPHSAVHAGVGGFSGDMGLTDSSPNDPLFFLHHAQVDRLWWKWQQMNPVARTYAYSGLRNEGNGPAATLNDVLPMLGLAPNGIVRDYMDVKGPKLCYKY